MSSVSYCLDANSTLSLSHIAISALPIGISDMFWNVNILTQDMAHQVCFAGEGLRCILVGAL